MKTPEEFLNDSEFDASIIEDEELYIEKDDMLELMERYAQQAIKSKLIEAAGKIQKETFKRVGRVNEGLEIAEQIILSLIPKETTK